jgi:hypothetical protein
MFNTEAHPIDGACLECCRSLNLKKNNENDQRDNSNNQQEDEQWLFLNNNLETLVNKYIKLIKNADDYDDDESDDDFIDFESGNFNDKSMEEEFTTLSETMKQEDKLLDSIKKRFCEIEISTNSTKLKDKLHKVNQLNNDYHSRKDNYYSAFTCSLKSSFRIRTKSFNSQSFFP